MATVKVVAVTSAPDAVPHLCVWIAEERCLIENDVEAATSPITSPHRAVSSASRSRPSPSTLPSPSRASMFGRRFAVVACRDACALAEVRTAPVNLSEFPQDCLLCTNDGMCNIDEQAHAGEAIVSLSVLTLLGFGREGKDLVAMQDLIQGQLPLSLYVSDSLGELDLPKCLSLVIDSEATSLVASTFQNTAAGRSRLKLGRLPPKLLSLLVANKPVWQKGSLGLHHDGRPNVVGIRHLFRSPTTSSPYQEWAGEVKRALLETNSSSDLPTTQTSASNDLEDKATAALSKGLDDLFDTVALANTSTRVTVIGDVMVIDPASASFCGSVVAAAKSLATSGDLARTGDSSVDETGSIGVSWRWSLPDQQQAQAAVRSHLGAMDSVVAELFTAMSASFQSRLADVHPQLSPWQTSFVGRSPCVALLSGPPGTGKTELAHSLRRCADQPFIEDLDKLCSFKSAFNLAYVSCPQLFGAYGAFEALASIERDVTRVRACTAQRLLQPTLLILDDVDALSPRSASGHEAATTAQLCQMMDRLNSQQHLHGCFVLMLTSRPEHTNPRVMFPSRIGYRIRVPPSTPRSRLDILRTLVKDSGKASEDMLRSLADTTHGYVGADLEKLVREAVLSAVRRSPEAALPLVAERDWREALASVTPSQLAGVQRLAALNGDRSSDTTATSDGLAPFVGLEDAVQQVRTQVLVPLREQLRPFAAAAGGSSAGDHSRQAPTSSASTIRATPLGILIHGPPGSGKTSLAVALARAANINVIDAVASELRSKVVGESERAVARLFAKARACSPCMLVLDQIEVIGERGHGSDHSSSRLISALTHEMDACLQHNKDNPHAPVLVVGTAKIIDGLDEGLFSIDRFPVRVKLPLPDRQTLARLLLDQLGPHGDSSINQQVCNECLVLFKPSCSLSAADIIDLARETYMCALRSDMGAKSVSRKDLIGACRGIDPSFDLQP